MSAEQFLAGCQRVKRMGPGRWIACCPAHEDSTPSMNVKEMPDGKVLAICRAGCHTQAILDAMGLPWSVLFAEDKPHLYHREAKKAFPAADVLEALNLELWVIAILVGDIKKNRAVKDEDYERLQLAIDRVQAARSMTVGEPILDEFRKGVLGRLEKTAERIDG